ncbi:MATE family efflux transporter [soil metagenome]
MSALAGEERSRAPWLGEILAMLALSWPMILTNVAQVAMTSTDVMMMGWLGPTVLASGALGTNLYFGPMLFGLGLMIATSPLMASAIGRKRHAVRDVRRTVRAGLWTAAGISIPIWIVLWNAETILRAIGQDAVLSEQSGHYVRALQWSIFPFYGYVVLRAFISALERPGWALVIAVFAVAFNAFANWCLMFGNLGFPPLGIVGSGIATALSSTAMFVGLIVVVTCDRQFRRYHLFGRFWIPDWPRMRILLRLGLPVSGLLAFEVTLFNAAAFLMGLINAESLAAHAIAIQISSVSFMIPLALGQAATVRVGLAFGSRDRQAVYRAGWTAFTMSAGFMSLMALSMFLFPYALIGVFIDIHNPENAAVVNLAVTFLAFAALFQLVDGAQAVTGGMLRGLHDTKLPMVYAAISYWGVGLPLGVALAFPGGLAGAGIWIGLCGGLAVDAVLLLVRWLKRDDIVPHAHWDPPPYQMRPNGPS